MAVDYIHLRGIVHGDLHLGNILQCLPSGFDTLSIEELYTGYSLPRSEPIIREDGQPLGPGIPKNAILPLWLGKPSERLLPSEANTLLSDFGESFKPSTENQYEPHIYHPRLFSNQPNRFRSPLISGHSLDDITAEQVDVLGPLPPECWNKWCGRYEYFDEDGTVLPDRHFRSWEGRFELHIHRPRLKAGLPGIGTDEKVAFLEMLRLMMAFRPETRATVREVMECEWMMKWGLPGLEEASKDFRSHDA